MPTLIPIELLPLGDSHYDAFVGVSWTFSRNMGVTRVQRAGDDIRVQLPGGGTGSLAPDEAAPGGICVKVRLPGSDEVSVAGVPTRMADGVEVRAADGRAVRVTRQRDHVAIALHGFGARDAVGVYLRPRQGPG